MSVLTHTQIRERLNRGDLAFQPPLDSFQLQTHSIDLRLGYTFMIPKIWQLTSRGRESLDIFHFDKKNSDYFEVVELEEGQYFDLLPQEYILVSTLESLKIPTDLMAVLYPRSSTNRKGLSLDLSGIIDSGYEGQLTLPIRNNTRSQTVRLYPGERLCQIVLEELNQTVTPRLSKYHKRDLVDGVRQESDEEVKLILSGKIKDLKKQYPV